ncbi:MAG: DNA-processing protein DprA, partial [Verrucomicrobiota bacterium]
MAEVLKCGAIADSKLFASLAKGAPRSMAKVVKRCVEIKAKLAGEDEKDLKGKRALLNFGHTVAHGLEGILGYDGLRHGEAVAIGMAVAESIRGWEKTFDLAAELEKIRKHRLKVIDCEDPDYPPLLREIHDPPMVLYYRGSLEAVKGACIGVVGTRDASGYGIDLAKKLGYQLAFAGIGVVSGLARGIDTAAHQGALAAKGKTAAVLGCSLDQIYPAENEVLAEKMAEAGGLVMSEFCLGTPPDRQTFPMRNRIVSGLSKGLLVIEAARASG